MKYRLFVIIDITIVITLTLSLLWLYKQNTLLSRNSYYAIAGTQENYSWAVAKFSIKLAEFDSLIERKLRIKDEDKNSLKSNLDIIFSRVKVIRDRTQSTRFLYSEPGYQETIDEIYQLIILIDDELKKNDTNYNLLSTYSKKIKEISYNLNNLADHAEVGQRTIALDDFLSKRDSIRTLFYVVYGLIILLCALSYLNRKYLRKTIESEKQAFNNKNAFLGKLGHELRTSLQAVIGSIEIIINTPSKPPSETTIKRLENAAIQIERQMSDLAEYAKVDNGSIVINNSHFEVSSLIKNTVSQCFTPSINKKIEIIIPQRPELSIYSDSSRISQITENLLTNAIKYTEKGTITVDHYIFSDSMKKYLYISVKDTGVGIPKKDLKSIFKPFVRIESDTSKIPGSGMGLAIVEGVVKAMKGSVSVKSQLGYGSEFIVKIPVILSNKKETDFQIEHSASGVIHKGIEILFVDDSEETVAIVSSMLKSCGYKCEKTTSPNRAYQKLMRKPYDLVLSDLQMPLMNGEQLLSKIRTGNGPNKTTPFIFITAYTDTSPDNNTIVITKPARISDINTAINATLSLANDS